MRWLLLFAVAGLVGCGQSKPDVWSEYADAAKIVEHEEQFLNRVRAMTADDPTDENKALEKSAEARFDVATKHMREVRSRLPK